MLTCTFFPTRDVARRAAGGVALLCMILAPGLQAQSAQPFSLQAAALMTSVRSGSLTINGVGIEPQFRFNRVHASEDLGAISVGIGGQYSLHSGQGQRMQLAGVFVEPRWALPFSAGCAFPYLSARTSVLRVLTDEAAARDASNGYAAGAGAGVTFRVTSNANLAVGAQYLRQQLGATRSLPFGGANGFAARLGVTLGLPR